MIFFYLDKIINAGVIKKVKNSLKKDMERKVFRKKVYLKCVDPQWLFTYSYLRAGKVGQVPLTSSAVRRLAGSQKGCFSLPHIHKCTDINVIYGHIEYKCYIFCNT